MCVPLRIEDRVLGSVYLDTRKIGHRFTEEDLELFATLAAQSALAIDNARLYERMVEAEKKRANLGRFLSPAIVDMVMREDTRLELGGAKRTVTTMFCDIRGFTPMAERGVRRAPLRARRRPPRHRRRPRHAGSKRRPEPAAQRGTAPPV
jgi:adenylate cyclase